jgi:hypothetical protein
MRRCLLRQASEAVPAREGKGLPPHCRRPSRMRPVSTHARPLPGRNAPQLPHGDVVEADEPRSDLPPLRVQIRRDPAADLDRRLRPLRDEDQRPFDPLGCASETAAGMVEARPERVSGDDPDSRPATQVRRASHQPCKNAPLPPTRNTRGVDPRLRSDRAGWWRRPPRAVSPPPIPLSDERLTLDECRH